MRENLGPSRAYPEVLFKEYGLHLGAPLSPDVTEELLLTVPETPHIFMARSVTLSLPAKKGRKETAPVTFSNVFVLLGQVRFDFSSDEERENEGNWIFTGTHRPVVKTVTDYEEIAKKLCLPHLDVIITSYPGAQFNPNKYPQIPYPKSNFPYVYSQYDSSLRSQPRPPVLYPGEGADLVVESSRWEKLLLWKKYWKFTQAARNSREVPPWATQPYRIIDDIIETYGKRKGLFPTPPRIHPWLDGNGRVGRLILKRVLSGAGFKDIIFYDPRWASGRKTNTLP